MNPEFLTEGKAVDDFMHPDRIVLGGIDDAQRSTTLGALYARFAGRAAVRTNRTTAEMIKYASNALLATLDLVLQRDRQLCAALGGVDAMDVMRGVHLARSTSGPRGDGLPRSRRS